MKYLGVVLIWAISLASHSSEDVSAAVDRYLEDFNRKMPALELVNAHWHPEAAIYSPDGVRLFNDYDESAGWLEQVQVSIAKDGWVRSEIVASAVCNLGDTLALYSMKFKRVFSDGREVVSGGTYTLVRSDKWRIASAVFANPDELVRCDKPGA